MTRSQTRARESPVCHSLNFFCDSDNDCAYTTLVKGFRFHIIAEAKRLRSDTEKGRDIERQYTDLIRCIRKQSRESQASDTCEISGSKTTRLRDAGRSGHTQDSGKGSSVRNTPEEDNEDVDSAVDVREQEEKTCAREKGEAADHTVLNENDYERNEQALKEWMLAPFAQIFKDIGSEEGAIEAQPQSLHQWYNGPTYFYSLEVANDEVCPVELESQPDLEDRIKALVPHITVPRYIRELEIPWIRAEDIVVISESDEPDPYHPSRVENGGVTRFFKAVDPTMPQPTKRELKIMKEIESKDLHQQIRVPLVTGLVGYEDSKTEIMGFLMTEIEDPTPLTKMLDTDVIEDEREKWAKETERMVKVLHDNNIIWGDAKADNFMVDKHGDLWIIDFGGSYTDGWVDPELAETIEGDIMGTEKIVNALKDPEANTYDPDEKEDDRVQKEDEQRPRESPGKKRVHDGDVSDVDQHISTKKQRRDSWT